jgi:hypothetical protein
MKKIIVLGIILVILLGSSISALAQTHYTSSKTESSISVSSGEDYDVYIGAGMFRFDKAELFRKEGKFGFGWYMLIEKTGDTPINGICYMKTMTLSGKVICDEFYPFSIDDPVIAVAFSGATGGFPPINYINLSVEIGNMTYSRSGYEIGLFVLLVD